ncbi:probable WRKY transcription factor 35 isoform X2 [Cryptomeria japonica]|uniref:probable WRKY transcription factor 35 isoform X2 n=1 Tax=Cryptomeria japonica TaxID=3369 RepID=UPI0027DAA57C|nr:probable WRKY transcription factor 35 isoform X2 [Cryptomeria japonica]
MGTWCKMSDGGDFGPNTVICSTAFDSNSLSFTHLLTSSGAAIYDDDVFLGGCENSVENPPLHSPSFFSTAEDSMNKDGCDKKVTPRLPNIKQEPISSENTESVDSETHKNPSSLSKLCPSSKIPGIKKRKSQQRKIMQIPMTEGSWNKQGGAGVPSDLWSWRKYGQKPIKGSPYPRCSSSKGCPARKQLERSFTDPTMIIITYTEDHNHAWPPHRRSSAQTPLEVQPVSSLAPNSSDCASPQNEEKERANSEVMNSSIEEEDPYNNNQVVEDNLFADFGEPPELDGKDFSNHSDEEEGSTMIDPFNLFDWSFSTNEIPIHDECF